MGMTNTQIRSVVFMNQHQAFMMKKLGSFKGPDVMKKEEISPLKQEHRAKHDRIMNPQETEQVVACDQLWVPTTERVNISTTNVRLKPQSGIHHIRSKDSESYEVLLANKKYVIDVEVLGRSLIFVPKKEESYKLFILYSTSQIPPKKSRGKGLQGKKTADTTEESVEKATISVDDNIIPEPDIALELGKSISLAEAEEEAAAREVHDTHARIMTESVPEPARTIRQSSIAFRDTSSVSKKRRLDRKKIIGRQPGTGGSDEGTGEIPGVLDESIFADAEDDNEETESDSEDIYKYRINVRKNADIEMKDAEKTADITKETTEQPLTSSSFSVPSDYGNQFLNLSHDEESNKQPPVLQQTTPTPTTIPTPPINTEAPTITTAIPEITPFIALQLRVAKLEQDMSEVKKIDHSAAVLASIQSHFSSNLVEKYSVLPALESSKKQESEKSPKEIIRIKREQEEKKQEPTYTIKSTDKAALEEFDLKSALFKSMLRNQSTNRNPIHHPKI
ncbi:hypothetical protein Tco_1344853 [Tanacetum coccineum]